MIDEEEIRRRLLHIRRREIGDMPEIRITWKVVSSVDDLIVVEVWCDETLLGSSESLDIQHMGGVIDAALAQADAWEPK